MGRDPIKGGQRQKEDMKAEGRECERGRWPCLFNCKQATTLFISLVSDTVAREPLWWCWVEFLMKNGLHSHNREGRKAWRIKCCVTLCKRERKRKRERDLEQKRGIMGAWVFAADIQLFARKVFWHLFVRMCISKKKTKKNSKLFCCYKPMKTEWAGEGGVIVEGGRVTGRAGGRERERETETETGRARFLD